MAVNRTVDLDGVGIPREEPSAAGATLLPGHLVEQNLTGSVIDLDVHGVSGGPHTKTFVFENSALGGDISGTGTGAYANNDRIQYRSYPVGARVNAIAGGAVTAGDYVMSAGNGKLITLAAAGCVVGQALETGVDDDHMAIEITSGFQET